MGRAPSGTSLGAGVPAQQARVPSECQYATSEVVRGVRWSFRARPHDFPYKDNALRAASNNHYGHLLSAHAEGSLEGRKCVWPEYAATVSDKLSYKGIEFNVGDIVHCADVATRTVACVDDGRDLFLLVRFMAVVSVVSPNSRRWREDTAADVTAFSVADNIVNAVAWYADAGDVVVIRR